MRTLTRSPYLFFCLIFILTGSMMEKVSAGLSDIGDQLFKLVASDASPVDAFGNCVAISGTNAIVGADGDGDPGSMSGSAYLFDVSTGSERMKLTASDAEAGDHFGCSVGISGGTAIIGALYNDEWSGSAYLFDVSTGSEIMKLTASDADAGDWFGCSVAISGEKAVVGAYYDDEGGSNAGAAYVFDVATGHELMKLTASDAAANDGFGSCVAISGNTVIVGAPANDDAGDRSGSAYLFDVATGKEMAKLTASDAAAEDVFGFSVAISGTIAIVGACGNSHAVDYPGAAYLFDVTTGGEIMKLTASDGAARDWFGHSVDISGNTAISGAWGDDGGGSAYLFDVSTGSELMKLTASDAAGGDHFGCSAAINGNTAIVGADGDDGDIGSAYLFEAANPVAVRLIYFRALRQGEKAFLEWEVGHTADHAAFHVYREMPGEQRVKLTEQPLKGQQRYEFVDEAPPTGTVSYWLAEISRTATVSWHGPVALTPDVSVSLGVALAPVWPNPSRTSEITITYSMPEAGAVHLSILNTEGRLVRTLVNHIQGPGQHSLTWDGRADRGSRVPSGLYFVRLAAEGEVRSQKALLVH